jgi:hypothetical protein
MKVEMHLSNHARDTFVAPHLSKLTDVGAPDIREQEKSWVNNYILNTIFKFSIDYPHRQLGLRVLLSIEAAFQEYQAGRESMGVYVEKRHNISSYFHALRHFETSALSAYHAYDTIRTMIKKNLFTQNDRSPLQRLNHLQNIVKHANKDMGQRKVPEGFTVPIWVTNIGLECHDKTELSFSEFADLMTDLAKLADMISQPPSATTK